MLRATHWDVEQLSLEVATFIFNVLSLSFVVMKINVTEHVKTVTSYTEVISEEYAHACVLVSAATVYFDNVYVVD